MQVRVNSLWKVPVFCAVTSWASFQLTVYLGRFYITESIVDGVNHISADPLRSNICTAVLFLTFLLIGGLWFRRSMTKKEIAVSAAIASVLYFVVILAELCIPMFPVAWSVSLAYVSNWCGIFGSFLGKLLPSSTLVTILSRFAPLLFIPFGKKTKH